MSNLLNVQPLSKVELFTDGACIGNPGPGGWAALLQYKSQSQEAEKLIAGSEKHTTNNKMELQAVIEGLKSLKKRAQVDVYTDSQYIVNAFKQGWLDRWQNGGWKTAAREPVKNKEQWLELLELAEFHLIHWFWVKGHAGHEQNERVDAAARAEALLVAGRQ